jgi:hypothetical protein
MKEIVLGDNNLSASTVFRFRSLTLEHLETLQNFFSGSEQKHQGLEPSVSTPLFNDQVCYFFLKASLYIQMIYFFDFVIGLDTTNSI